MSMVVTAYVMVVMRGDTPNTEGAMVLTRGGNLSAVQWVTDSKGGGKEDVMAGALMRIFQDGFFRPKHVRGVESRPVNGVTR